MKAVSRMNISYGTAYPLLCFVRLMDFVLHAGCAGSRKHMYDSSWEVRDSRQFNTFRNQSHSKKNPHWCGNLKRFGTSIKSFDAAERRDVEKS